MGDIQTKLIYVKEAFTGNTGGGIFVDVLVLDDDTVLAIGSDGISF